MRLRFVVMALLALLLFVLNIFVGSVGISASEVMEILMGGEGEGPARFIVLSSRLPQAATAVLAGAALAVSGLLLQTAFRNPLAGPSILGISSGASLGVALVMLLSGGSIAAGTVMVSGYAAVMLGAFAGAMAIMGLLLLLSTILKNGLMLLITGILTGYFASSLIMILNYSASSQGVHGYVMWGMGSFSGVTPSQLPLFSAGVGAGLLLAFMLIKPLNLILLGDSYARNLGVNLVATRNMLMLSTGLLTATVTAYCGPISFIGLAVPHIARMIFRSDNHAVLVPATVVCGAVTALLCCLLTILPGQTILPVNAVTSLVGVPVILYVIMRRRK
ncbi:MAG: iron ABC transporter permease [Pseudoflavonifractor sp.]|nr:iron ABC transporter permease [Alloprevotella sp.]MCM1117436.1 iron ABC transporter permease [Pseudoflavonifractor sp.]